MMVPAPTTEAELMHRVRCLAGMTLQELACVLHICVPEQSRRAKGFAGLLLENALGASAASKPEPDFQFIGVELKTIPVDSRGRPKESTYVCTVPLRHHAGAEWAASTVKLKLSRVLWVPIICNKHDAVGRRRIGDAVIWSPTSEEENQIRADWEELMDKVCTGEVGTITAHEGTYLQIRPKAATSQSRGIGIEESGAPVPILPRGFYLRSSFTGKVLRNHAAMPK